MKSSLIVGTMLGVVAATAIYSNVSNNSMKKVKKVLMNKIEDIIM